jgi:hypothetical protein
VTFPISNSRNPPGQTASVVDAGGPIFSGRYGAFLKGQRAAFRELLAFSAPSIVPYYGQRGWAMHNCG